MGKGGPTDMMQLVVSLRNFADQLKNRRLSSSPRGVAYQRTLFCSSLTINALDVRNRFVVFPWRNSLQWARDSSLSRFYDHTQTHQVRLWLLCKSDKPNAETSTWQNTTIARDIYPCPRRDSKPQSQKRADADPSRRWRGQWGRQRSHTHTK
jgi:hypothetical protein